MWFFLQAFKSVKRILSSWANSRQAAPSQGRSLWQEEPGSGRALGVHLTVPPPSWEPAGTASGPGPQEGERGCVGDVAAPCLHCGQAWVGEPIPSGRGAVAAPCD